MSNDAQRHTANMSAAADMYGADRQVDSAKIGADASRDVATTKAGADIHAADKSAEASMYGADQTRIASMHGSDMQYKGIAATGEQQRLSASQANKFEIDKENRAAARSRTSSRRR